MRPIVFVVAALAFAPAVALAQPASHHSVGQVFDIEGEVFQPAGGGPIIGVNKSNSFQVQNAPFRALLAGSQGRRVKARVKMVQPGPFGGRVDVIEVKAANDGSEPLRVRSAANSAAPVIGSIAPGRDFTITGATARYVAVKLGNGRRGHVLRTGTFAIGELPGSSAEGGAEASGLARLDRFEFTSLIDWDRDQLKVHLTLVRRPDGSYRADVLGKDLVAREDVPVSVEAVADIVAAIERFQSIPDDTFGGPGIDMTYTVLVEGVRGDGSKMNLGRAFYEPVAGEPRRQVRDLKATVEAIVASLSAGPVGGPVTGIIGSLPGN